MIKNSHHLRALLASAREYVADAVEAHNHSDGAELIAQIDQALAPLQPDTSDEWPMALARLQNTEPGPGQGLAVVGTQDLAMALDRLHQFAEVALGNATEISRLTALINTPETADFLKGVSLEMPHQRERWGAAHDAGKDALDWVWLLGHLVNKAARAAIDGDADKALHHTISSAAALGNWHAAISGHDTTMRPGVDAVARGWEQESAQ